MGSEIGIGEALGRIAETFGRLVVQHLQLLRSELESEARSVAVKGRAIAIWAPFVIAGVVVASLAVGQLLGLLTEPLLGRFATPLATLIVGVAEALLAGRWMRMHLPPAGARGTTSESSVASSTEPPRVATRAMKAQEKVYGAVG